MKEYGTDWSNLDLNDDYQRNLPILNDYSLDGLLLEVNCNIPNITKETIRKQFLESLNSKVQSAKEIFEDNLDNILKYAIEYRKDK